MVAVRWWGLLLWGSLLAQGQLACSMLRGDGGRTSDWVDFFGSNGPDMPASLLGVGTNWNNTGIVQTSGTWQALPASLLATRACILDAWTPHS